MEGGDRELFLGDREYAYQSRVLWRPSWYKRIRKISMSFLRFMS